MIFINLSALFFRYNFMPLSRGTAAVGFVVMLGLLLAANMEFTGSIKHLAASYLQAHIQALSRHTYTLNSQIKTHTRVPDFLF